MDKRDNFKLACGWIHRRIAPGEVTELQCPLCGQKVTCYPDEDHKEIEGAHGKVCRVKNRVDTITYG
jgi:hypothetical protein